MRPNQPRSRVERGETLVEVLMAVVILSVGVIGIVNALTSSLTAADHVRGRADASQVVTLVADAIQRAPGDCNIATPTDSYKTSTLDALRPTVDWTIVVTGMTHWGQSRNFEVGCPATGAINLFRTEQMTILVQAPGVRGRQVVALVKRP